MLQKMHFFFIRALQLIEVLFQFAILMWAEAQGLSLQAGV